MKFLYDFFPVILFFLVYKLYPGLSPELVAGINAVLPLALTPGESHDAIFLATAAAILASFVQVGAYWLRRRRFENTHLISLALISVFGGATLALRDPVFIMWKPTLLNWGLGLALLVTHFIGEKPAMERLMGHAVSVPRPIWRRVNLAWIGFFLVTGLVNLYVAFNFSEAIWVNFKLFGTMGMTLVFIVAQSLYLARFMEADEQVPGEDV